MMLQTELGTLFPGFCDGTISKCECVKLPFSTIDDLKLSTIAHWCWFPRTSYCHHGQFIRLNAALTSERAVWTFCNLISRDTAAMSFFWIHIPVAFINIHIETIRHATRHDMVWHNNAINTLMRMIWLKIDKKGNSKWTFWNWYEPLSQNRKCNQLGLLY